MIFVAVEGGGGCVSVPVEAGRGCDTLRRKGVRLLWQMFPHVVLILSLIGYAVLGACLFQAIEGRDKETLRQEYHAFVRGVVETARKNISQDELLDEVGQKIKNYTNTKEWNFFQSLFFCCTVFTTVGYGEIYPVTQAGKMACILYAMVGIPLMLLVLSDAGDILAVLFSNAYQRLHSHCKLLFSCRCRPRSDHEKPHQGLVDGTYTFSPESTGGLSLDIRQVIRAQSMVKRKSVNLINNMEIFDRIVAREKFAQVGRLARTCSCPQLNQMPPPPEDFKMWDFSAIGQEMERFNVPFFAILLMVFTYILCWALILPFWETELSIFDAFYFCFITLTTIGFGDIVPKHPNYFMLTFLFIIMGMAIMSMAFKLGLTRIVRGYHRCISCLSCLGLGRAGSYKVQGGKK